MIEKTAGFLRAGALEGEAKETFREHVAQKAVEARWKYGLYIDTEAILKMLADPEVVRYPTSLRVGAEGLLPGEFAHAQPIGWHASDGCCLWLHPHFARQREIWPLLIAYHIPSINYGAVATHEEAELFGATLLGMEVDAYYAALCELADSVT